MIHHITAICSDAEKTNEFYTGVLGLRLVKVTVNQDDIGTYHIYFGDKTGSPGTVLTFFLWPDLPEGNVGPGMVSAVAFSAPSSSLNFWEKRLEEFNVKVSRENRFGEEFLSFRDPDGLPLEIVGSAGQGNWKTEDIPIENSIKAFYGATLLLEENEPTAEILTKNFGYSHEKSEGNWHRYSSETSAIDIHVSPDAHPGISGTGTVHHIAFRAKNDEEQKRIRQDIIKQGLHLTSVIDRFYFKSVYFREPGRVLFEIATDGPGFAVDEPEDSLGEKLVLPPAFEHLREKIEKMLPEFNFQSKI